MTSRSNSLPVHKKLARVIALVTGLVCSFAVLTTSLQAGAQSNASLSSPPGEDSPMYERFRERVLEGRRYQQRRQNRSFRDESSSGDRPPLAGARGFDPAMRTADRPGNMQSGAFGGYGGFRATPGRRPAIDLTPLQLTEEQRTKIEAMREVTRNKARDLRKNLMHKQIEMRNLMFSPDATEGQIRAVRKELRALQDQVDENNLNALLHIRSLLTPEQRKHLPECMPARNPRAVSPWNERGPGAGITERRFPGNRPSFSQAGPADQPAAD